MTQKTLEEYLDDEHFNRESLTTDEGDHVWFINDNGGIYTLINPLPELRAKKSAAHEQEKIVIAFKSYNTYLRDVRIVSHIQLHLKDSEATYEEHERARKSCEAYWKDLHEEEKREIVQSYYNDGGELSEEEIRTYGVKILAQDKHTVF